MKVEKITRERARPYMRALTQTCVILLLVAAGWIFNDRIADLREADEQSQATTAAVNSILAQSCGVASFEELRRQGLVEECRLAQDGKLADAIPSGKLPAPGAKPADVDADVVDDDSSATPADLRPNTPTSDVIVERAVASYFAANPLDMQPGYSRAISRSVASYLSANPPKDGRPPTKAEIRDAVTAALVANPPPPGKDGRSVTGTTVDGCEVVFTYSDGSTVRTGAVCGKDGKDGKDGAAPSDEQIAAAVVAYCTANGECRGPAGPPGEPGVVQTADDCNPPPGEYVTDVSISGPVGEPATITISCSTAPLLPLPPVPSDSSSP